MCGIIQNDGDNSYRLDLQPASIALGCENPEPSAPKKRSGRNVRRQTIQEHLQIAWRGQVVRVFVRSARAAGRGASHRRNHTFSRVRRHNLRGLLLRQRERPGL